MMSDIFDDALEITKEAVEAQVAADIGTLETVYQENRALEAEIAQQKKWALEAQERAGGEIERLRRDKTQALYVLEMANEQIERLKKERLAMSEHVEAVNRRNAKLKAERIQVIQLNDGRPKEIFTHKMIDEAWAFVVDPPGHLSNEVKEAVEAALGALGIKRCEATGCNNGIYTEGNDDGSRTIDRPCEVCGGHEWVRTEESEE